MKVFVITALVALATVAVGQGRKNPKRPEPARAIDVHILELETQPGAFVPSARIVASKRLSLDGPEAAREVHVQAGGSKLKVEIRESDGYAHVKRSVGRPAWGVSPPARTLDCTEPNRWARVPRHGAHLRAVIMCEPVEDATRAFVALDPKGFMRHVVDIALEPDASQLADRVQELSPTDVKAHARSAIRHPENVREQVIRFVGGDWLGATMMAARVLGSVPLREYLEPAQIDRILAAAEKIPELQDATEALVIRPLVALGHRPVLARLLGDVAGQREGETIEIPQVPRHFYDSLLVAYATAPDPETRGLAGWLATSTQLLPLYDALIADVASGRAVLPGDEEQRAREADFLQRTRAWQSVTAPLLTLGGSAIAIAVIMLLLRSVLRRAL